MNQLVSAILCATPAFALAADSTPEAKPQHTYLAQAIGPYEPIYFLGTNSPVTGAKFPALPYGWSASQ